MDHSAQHVGQPAALPLWRFPSWRACGIQAIARPGLSGPDRGLENIGVEGFSAADYVLRARCLRVFASTADAGTGGGLIATTVLDSVVVVRVVGYC